MIRTRIPKLFAIAAAAACLFGLVMVAPVANADTLPNGLIVNCTKDSEFHVTCVVSGCPRVDGDYVVDVLHYILSNRNGRNNQVEVGFKCINGETARVGWDNENHPFDLGVQACRKRWPDKDACTPYNNYTYTPPAAPKPAEVPPLNCPAGSETPTVPAGQQCKLLPVQCPPGSETPTVPAGQQCKAIPPKKCPDGSVKPEVPAAENCSAPTNAVRMTIDKGALQATVNVTNTSALGGTCAYDAKATGGIFAPNLSRQINLGPNASTSIDVPAPPLGSSYHVVLSCKGTYDGKQVEFGHVEQDVSSF